MDKEILYKYLKCETSPDEEERIAAWLEADAGNRKVMDEIRLKAETLALIAPVMDELYEKDRRPAVRFAALRRWSVAAAAVLLFGLGVSYLTATHVQRKVGGTMLSFASEDAPVRYTLSDGTSVWLNTHTRIEFPAVFVGDRKVRIAGEALFDVAHDSAHPFVVATPACDVRVLGTQFNVRADAEGRQFETALLRGRVEVVNRATDSRLVLEPNQRAVLRDGTLVRETIADPDDYLCMAEGYINLKGHTFEEIIARIGQVFGVEIDSEGVDVGNEKFWWGKIRIRDGVDNAMKVLRNAYPIQYEYDRERNAIEISNR